MATVVVEEEGITEVVEEEAPTMQGKIQATLLILVWATPFNMAISRFSCSVVDIKIPLSFQALFLPKHVFSD